MIFKNISPVLAFYFSIHLLLFNISNVEAQRGKKDQQFIVNKIKLEGNTILDDKTLSKSSELGNGIQMDNLMRMMLTAEIEGYYASHGFYLIKAHYPNIKPKNGKLTLFLDERNEIKTGLSDRERALESLSRLVSYRKLDTPEAIQEEVISKLIQGYKIRRLANSATEQKKITKQKARLMAELGKRASEEKNKK